MSTSQHWNSSSWRGQQALQLPQYPSLDEVTSVESILTKLPPLVTPREIEALKLLIAKAAEGKSFLLQMGDCAESFKDCNQRTTQKKIHHLVNIGNIFAAKTGKSVVHVGRIAGQYTKPRSAAFEVHNDQKICSYLGDMVNSYQPDLLAREPNPLLMLKGYGCALSIIKKLKKYNIQSVRNKKIYTSHEALLLFYEQALTKYDPHSKHWYDLSTHFPWLGMRTAFQSPAHVEYLRGIENPLAIKLGPEINVDQLIATIELLDPYKLPGRLTLIHRLGINHIRTHLPKIIKAVSTTKRKVLWCCDPMHGNTENLAPGLKIRKVEKIAEEIALAFSIHKQNGTYLGGIHLEATHNNVIECISESDNHSEEIIRANYKSLLDPRLNYMQSLQIIKLISATYASLYP